MNCRARLRSLAMTKGGYALPFGLVFNSIFSRHREERTKVSAVAIQKNEAAAPPIGVDCHGR